MRRPGRVSGLKYSASLTVSGDCETDPSGPHPTRVASLYRVQGTWTVKGRSARHIDSHYIAEWKGPTGHAVHFWHGTASTGGRWAVPTRTMKKSARFQDDRAYFDEMCPSLTQTEEYGMVAWAGKDDGLVRFHGMRVRDLSAVNIADTTLGPEVTTYHYYIDPTTQYLVGYTSSQGGIFGSEKDSFVYSKFGEAVHVQPPVVGAQAP